jgi:hypothetical protein
MNKSAALPSLADSNENRESTCLRSHTVISGENTPGPSDISDERKKIDSDELILI